MPRQLGYAHAAEVELVEPLLLREVARVALRRRRLCDWVAVLYLVLAVDDERDAVRRRQLRRQPLLAEDERLEGVQEIFEGQARQRAMYPSIGCTEIVVEAGVDPRLEVSPANLGVCVGRPRHGERIHPVPVFEDVRGVDGVLAAAAGHQHVVASIGAPIAREQVEQLTLALRPVRSRVLPLREAARVTDPLGVEVNRLFLRLGRVRVLDGRGGTLIGNHAAGAETYLTRQPELGLERHRRTHAGPTASPLTNEPRIASPTSPLFSGWN